MFLFFNVNKRIANVLSRYGDVILWGAGSSGEMAIDFLHPRVSLIIDTYAKIDSIQGIKVVPPEKLKQHHEKTLLVIASVSKGEITSWLVDNNINIEVITFFDLLDRALDTRKELQKLIIDLLLYYEKGWIETLLRRPQLLVNISYRVCAKLYNKKGLLSSIGLLFCRIIHTSFCVLFGIELPFEVVSGGGLVFMHMGAIVISRKVQFGKFCTIYQGVTIGTDKTGKAPILRNNIIVWAGAVVIGDCIIGNNTQIGANSVCLRGLNVQNVIVAGNPAKVIKQFDNKNL